MRVRLHLVGLILAIVVGVAVAVTGCGDDEPAADGSSATVEVLAPSDFTVTAYAGSPLVVNFFGSWCGPCRSEAPDLATFAADNTDVQFVGIAVNDEEDAAVAFAQEYGLSYPLVVDDGSLAAASGISGVPTTIFYSSGGQEADRIVGAAGIEQFEQSLAKAR